MYRKTYDCIYDELHFYHNDPKWQVSRPICVYFHMKSWFEYSKSVTTNSTKNISYRRYEYEHTTSCIVAEWEDYLRATTHEKET